MTVRGYKVIWQTLRIHRSTGKQTIHKQRRFNTVDCLHRSERPDKLLKRTMDQLKAWRNHWNRWTSLFMSRVYVKDWPHTCPTAETTEEEEDKHKNITKKTLTLYNMTRKVLNGLMKWRLNCSKNRQRLVSCEKKRALTRECRPHGGVWWRSIMMRLCFTASVWEWANQSPDLSPIEMQWNDLNRSVHTRPPPNMDELMQVYEEDGSNCPWTWYRSDQQIKNTYV